MTPGPQVCFKGALSVEGAAVANKEDVHLDSTVPGNPAFDERLNTMVQGMISRTGATLSDATEMAYKQLNYMVERQAYLLTYLDTFRLIAVFFIVVFPLVFFIKVRKPQKPDPAAVAAMEEAH